MSNRTVFAGSTHPHGHRAAGLGAAGQAGLRRVQKALCLAVWLLACCLGGSACSGKLFFNSPCANVPCVPGTVCQNGACVSDGVLTCNPLHNTGACANPETCLAGTCYNNRLLPAICSATLNGTCANNGSCQAGNCLSIDATNACSLNLPQGFCPGGQSCAAGYCYADSGDVLCSPTNLQGYCALGETCMAGTCQAFVGTCGPTNISGTCGTWQTCSEGAGPSLGVCVGPFAPDACSVSTPTGRCPADEVCVAGTCTPITASNVCEPLNPTGLCSAAAVCGEGGHCIVLDPNVACSTTHLTGPCSGGGICRNGVCQQASCSQTGGYACPAGQWCDAGACVPVPCDPVHPMGACADSTLACVKGICAPPTCSADNPYGVCSQGLVCFAGQCLLPACSASSPLGPCPDPINQVCHNGICVVGPCSPTRPDGTCTNRVCTDDPAYGCVLTMPAVCCDATLQAASGCAYGSCSTPLCSTSNPNGYCPQGELCVAGACAQATCGPFFLSGSCANPNATCTQGRCTLLNCTSYGATQAEQDAYCAPDVCDATYTGNCVTPACSLAHPAGSCPTGQACCNAAAQDSTHPATFDANCTTLGTCDVPTCSLRYPGGGCPAGQLCASGICQTPPCSTTYPHGSCGPNYQCTSGTCIQQPCSNTYPGGTCASGTRCTAGSCVPYICSATFPQAPCANGNKICQSGSCVTPTCSLAYPGGGCPAPQICSNGACIVPPCSTSVQTGTCPAQETCCNGTNQGSVYACTAGTHGKCVANNCSSSNKAGACSDSTQVCFTSSSNATSCQPYVCSANFPQGPCAATGTTCINNTCQQPNCDPLHPSGKCSAGQVCDNGTCVLPACSSANPNGACPPSQTCDSASHRCTLSPCSVTAPAGYCPSGKVCCNSSVEGAPGCTSNSAFGTCVSTACSAEFPYGQCTNPNTICVSSQCVAPCGPAAPLGWCPGGFACVERACATACANDQDCDLISDSDEGIATLVDTDGDGVPDAFDHDSDGDTIPDSIEAGDRNLATPPLDTDGDGIPNFRSLDSDGDFLPDRYEAGPAPGVPRDTDSDGKPDYIDTDSDGDGILDRCEAVDIAGQGICANHSMLAAAVDTDGDGIPDYRDTDSDNDGIADSIEARSKPADYRTLNSLGIDHDGDGRPDYRDSDSDGDGVMDNDEDVNGDGIVNCQVDGSGATVPDSRPTPTCGQTSAPFSAAAPYDYNPGCIANNQKCLLAETDRIVVDTDGNGIDDGADGIFSVCSANNLKPVNLFFSQVADYAYALETSYTHVRTLTQSNVQVGIAFDDLDPNNGSYAVSGMLLQRTPDPNAMAVTNSDPNQALIQKALAQATIDEEALAADGNVNAVALVINRNLTSFDGYGVVISRYTVGFTATLATAQARDILMKALDHNLDAFTPASGGPLTNDFTLTMQTLYRYDTGSTGSVLLTAAVSPTGTENTSDTYSYRTLCLAQTTSSTCWARKGCAWNGTACAQTSYQLPLFYADNITNGSGLTQYGDDLQATCQSIVQKNALVDFLWTVDNSASMTPKIGRVANASTLFFPLLNSTEADYRVSMLTTSASTGTFPPIFKPTYSSCIQKDTSQTNCLAAGCIYTASNPVGSRCYWGSCANLTTASTCQSNSCLWQNDACHFVGTPDRLDGVISHDFTGAVGGRTNLNSIDRSVSYACSETCTSPSGTTSDACGYSGYQTSSACPTALGCGWNGTACVMACCPACLSNSAAVPNDPACYFAARLPNDTGSGSEYGLLMTQWALYRAGVRAGCPAQTTQVTCVGEPGCIWSNNTCSQGYCAWSVTPNDPNHQSAQNLCNGNSPLTAAPSTPFLPPYPGQDLMPANCEWDGLADNGTGACVPSVGVRCASYSAANTAYGTTAKAQAACTAAAPRCNWTGSVCEPTALAGQVMCSATSSAACLGQAYGFCQWDTCSSYATSTACGGVSGCAWNGSSCLPVANGGTCRPPLKRMMRANATPVSLLVSDEEECYVKDGPGSNQGSNVAYDGSCAGGYFTGGLMTYNDPVRQARVTSYGQFMKARNLLTFALTGDKASTSLPPPAAMSGNATTLANGGCINSSGFPSPYYAEPGQAYINVAESTGGGWGSICAADLYPSIEAMVTSSLGKASPYKLSGFIHGHTVQPVSSTIEVAVQTCINAAEYPTCQSGTTVQVIPRSRDNGFDYDSVNNSLVLYGSARPVAQGSITVSYRYWDNRQQPSTGTAGGCPCPEATLPSCACPTSGEKCGKVGTTDFCAPKNPTTCAQTAGCVWNSANSGSCEVSGLCAADPNCGGVTCGTGLVCNPALGLCVCDPSCDGGSCTAGSTCDNNAHPNPCQGVTSANCGTVGGCAWNAHTLQCTSATCGLCLCDTTCGGGCPAGQRCNSNTASPSCGQCACDTTCGGGCPNNEVCNANPNTATCGLCEPPQCGHCPAGFGCNTFLNICICDQTCGGSPCAAGSLCDSSSVSATCGQCVCDLTCGGGCPVGQTCNMNTASPSCGFCQTDTTCGGCHPVCSPTDQAACNAESGCRWAPWLSGGNGACSPVLCKNCDSSTGLCHADSACCSACGPNETCNSSTGQCSCDTTCGGCPAGQVCNSNTSDIANCGACQCDTTCGGTCPAGEICNGTLGSPTCGFCQPDPSCGVGGMCNPPCSATTAAACTASAACQWEPWANSGAGACGPIACKACNQASGVCTTDPMCCGGCGPGQKCNPSTGSCICDTSCNGGCLAAGQVCDSNVSDGTCGQCVCDTTCGGACPTGEVCDTDATSGTCGACIIDISCGGSCPYPLVCNSTTGLCGPDHNCGGCAGNYTCDITTGQCVPPGG